MVTETHRKLIDNFYKLEAKNKRLREALEAALLWTDEEHDVFDWRPNAEVLIEKLNTPNKEGE